MSTTTSTTLATYFQTKLKEIEGSTNNKIASILKQVSEGKFDSLSKLSQSLADLKEEKNILILDIVNNLSILDVIAISTFVPTFSKNTVRLLDEKELSYAYKFKTRGISIEDRNLLVSTFGPRLKDARVL